MAGGLAALLDDVATIAKMASVAGTKAAALVVDDTAVTPQYVEGVAPARELPIIGKIALGSVRNKLLFILPAILLMSQFAPWLLTPLLMLGGTYLSFEGAEKVWEAVSGRHETPTGAPDPDAVRPAAERGAALEAKLVRGALTTGFILASGIRVIPLNEVAQAGLVERAVALIIVGLAMTALVYGAVALIVKMDDVGLHLAGRDSDGSKRLGRLLVRGMPAVLGVLSAVGLAAMLWVGGHIVASGADKLGWHAPMELLHLLAGPAEHLNPFLGWLVDSLVSAAIGLVLGAVVVAVLHLLPFRRAHGEASAH